MNLSPVASKFLAFLVLFWATQVAGAPLTVYFVTGQNGSMPAEILDGIKKQIEGRSSAQISKARFDGVFRPDELVIAFGVEGAKGAARLDSRIPVLGIFVPKKAFDAILPLRNSGKFSAIFIDQPLERQMMLARLAFSKSRHVGVLLGPNSSGELPSLQKAASVSGIELSAVTISSRSEMFSALELLLKKSDVMLAVPDPLVFNSDTISGILLSAYRHNIPLIGFSPSYVRAGALAALYSSVEQVGWQTAEAVSEFSRTGVLPQPEYPVYFTVGINKYVARSMGIEIQDEATFEEKLSHTEGAP